MESILEGLREGLKTKSERKRGTFVEGDSWFLCSVKWARDTLDGKRVPLDNSDLLVPLPPPADEKKEEEEGGTEGGKRIRGVLREGLEEGSDYILLDKGTWTDLLKELTMSPGQEPISRKVLRQSLEIYPQASQDKRKDLKEFGERLKSRCKQPLVEGETWYLLSVHWFKALKRYLEDSQEVHQPGPVDNSCIVDDNDELKKGLKEREHFEFVDEESWSEIIAMFSISSRRKALPRKVVSQGDMDSSLVVDVYPLRLYVTDASDETSSGTGLFSKYQKPESVEKQVRKMLNIDSNVKIRIRIKFPPEHSVGSASSFVGTLGESSISMIGVQSGFILVVEKANSDGTWSKTRSANNNNSKESSVADSSCSSLYVSGGNAASKQHSIRELSSVMYSRYCSPTYSESSTCENTKPGVCGIANLGNTCFMNSIIQGLSNTPPITEYFANDNYIEDINKDNPLGMKGEIAKTFGLMIKSMWSGRQSYVVPREFKMAVGRFAPQFSGYQQQDSQELLTFLLDGLHEDLNRIKKKPYIEMKDSGERPDDEVAREAWEIYKKRNDSVILDLFHGLLKSTLVCPVCSKVSVTFDPFCYLALPLPVGKDRQVEVLWVPFDKSKRPKKYKITVPKSSHVRDLQKALSKKVEVNTSKMVVTEIFSHKFQKILYEPDEILSMSDRNDITVYEVPPKSNDIVHFYIYFRERETSSSPLNLFGRPFIIAVPKNVTAEGLYNEILSHINPFMKTPDPNHQWWKNEDTRTANGQETLFDGLSSDEGSSSPVSDPLGEVKMKVDEDDDDDEEEVSSSDDVPPKIFCLNFINAFGNITSRPIDVSSKNVLDASNFYIGLDWSSKTKSFFYEKALAETVNCDESVTHDFIYKKPVIKLSDCLELYSMTEKLGENDAWYCPRCRKHQEATKKFDLWSLPSVLVISLKRFSYSRNWRDKLDTMVDFPVKNLDMSPYIINYEHGQAIYDLIAVSNHYGVMGGGHYTAFGKNKYDEQWYHFDDAKVTMKEEKDVITNAAYVLFYQRRDTSETRTKASSTCTSDSLHNGLNGVEKINSKNGNVSSEEDEEEEKMDIN